MEKEIRIFESQFDLAEELALRIYESNMIAVKNGQIFNVALSGGATPKILFSILAEKYADRIDWKNINLYWGDERCVSPEDEESNYGMTRKSLLDLVQIPEENIHRIMGENIPEREAERYSAEIRSRVKSINGIPSFNLFLLGIGEDGHTASIFPDRMDLFDTFKICDVTVHYKTLQRRITITGPIINNSSEIVFLATGERKAKIVSEILNTREQSLIYPAANIIPVSGRLSWYLNKSAAIYL